MTYDPKKGEEELENYMADVEGKTKRQIILLSPAKAEEPETQPLFARETDKDLSDMSSAPEPTAKFSGDLKNLKFPDDPQELRRLFASLPSSVTEQFFNAPAGVTGAPF